MVICSIVYLLVPMSTEGNRQAGGRGGPKSSGTNPNLNSKPRIRNLLHNSSPVYYVGTAERGTTEEMIVGPGLS